MESTYGNREHDDKDPRPALAALVKEIVASKGVLLIPAFAVGRTQEILLILRDGMKDGSIPRVPVHLDSPMAIDATEIYCKYTEDQKVEHPHQGGKGCVFFFGQLDLSQTVEESKRLNLMPGPRVIISASGMATGGRVDPADRRAVGARRSLGARALVRHVRGARPVARLPDARRARVVGVDRRAAARNLWLGDAGAESAGEGRAVLR